MESFGNAGYTDMYLTLERGLRHITARGKILIAQFYNASQAERYRRTGMYMLIKNQNSFINIADGTVNWFPEYEIDLGDQSAVPTSMNAIRVAGSGSGALFKRDYSNGMVLCNTFTGVLSYTLTGSNWYKVVTSGGGSVDANGNIASESITYVPVAGSVSVNPSDCMILKNMTAAEVAEAENNKAGFSISPNPAHNSFTISLNIQSPMIDSQLNICDVTGRMVYENVIRNLKFEIRNSFSPGLYFVQVREGEKVWTEKLMVE
jgi:hypothetical protein